MCGLEFLGLNKRPVIRFTRIRQLKPMVPCLRWHPPLVPLLVGVASRPNPSSAVKRPFRPVHYPAFASLRDSSHARLFARELSHGLPLSIPSRALKPAYCPSVSHDAPGCPPCPPFWALRRHWDLKCEITPFSLAASTSNVRALMIR